MKHLVQLLPRSDPLYDEMDRVRRYLLFSNAGFAGIALWPEWVIIDGEDPRFGDQYGFTDGRTIFLGVNLFKNEQPKAVAYVQVHEVLHVALRHPQRGLALRKKRLMSGKPWSDMVFNWAVDAIVNHCTDKIIGSLQRPSVKLVTFDALLDSQTLSKTPPTQWGAEALFEHLMDNVIMPKVKSGQLKQAVDDFNEQKGFGKEMMDIELSDGFTQEETNGEQRDWEKRVQRAAAGDKALGAVREALMDIPKTYTNWRQLLRQFVAQYVMPETVARPSKPSRACVSIYSASRAKKRAGLPFHKVPWLPAFGPKPGMKRIAVVIDTSGSIDEAMCHQFAGEIQSIRKTVGCALTLITCDASVHQNFDVTAQEDLFQAIKKQGGFKGGGGTDFRPGVAAAEKINGTSVIIYLTDMMGSYPDKCSKPILWASICEKYSPPPCGKVVVLKNIAIGN